MDRYLVLCSYRIRELTDAEKTVKVFLVCVYILENVEHCGGEPEQAATMATCT